MYPLQIDLPVYMNGFCLDTKDMERQMMEFTGLDLKKLPKKSDDIDVSQFKQIIPYHFGHDGGRAEARVQKTIGRYPKADHPFSMKVKDRNELAHHVSHIYQVSYAHYIIGTKHGSAFPAGKCHESSSNLALSLFEQQYPNATQAGNYSADHAYVLLPFVLESYDQAGVILVDPTSDQKWQGKTGPRNRLKIYYSHRWSYRTHWKNRAELFPESLASLDAVQENPKIFTDDTIHVGDWYSDGEDFLLKAFDNPISIGEFRKSA